jgi:UDP-N-acetylglucosamine:LPS N-acetylglucosamine transferase
MKRIVYLTFYFKPDLCAGSFRNSPLAVELANQAKNKDILIEVYTTLPNRYITFDVDAPEYEELNNLKIHRIALPPHQSGMIDQVFSFLKFYREVTRLNYGKKADLVYASSSRLFTAYLGYRIAKKFKTPLYLDIRDLFVDTIKYVLKNKLFKIIILPILKFIENKTFNYASHINLISEGFKDYFLNFQHTNFSYYSNGIDDEFVTNITINKNYNLDNKKILIVYAGNIGEGQGLHKIIPDAAKLLGPNYEFIIIGDGGNKKILENEIKRLGITNVILNNPISRIELFKFYNKANYLFLHLNDYPAFRNVLPSKIFELATFNKPILAGVSGYSELFIKNNIESSFVFEPCNVNMLVNYLQKPTEHRNIQRIEFVNKFKRSKINSRMAVSILNYI